MWGFAHRSPRALEVTPKHEELFRDADDPAEAITRETSQNSADAKSISVARVRMRFAHVALKRSVFEAHWLSGLTQHMSAWRSGLPADAFADELVDCLVIEDFGTTGLEGALNSSGGAFYAFWRQYGESPKAGNTGGRHGVGKSTLAGASKARMFFGLTVRESDGRKLLMGQTILGPHELNNQKYEAYGEFSPTTGDHMPEPFEGPKADQFASDFELERTDEPGLSLVVPAVRAGIIENGLEAVKRALVANCFPQVASELLEFDVAGDVLTRETLYKWAERYSDLSLVGAVEVALAASSPTKTWTAKNPDGELSAESFSEDQLSEMRLAFVTGELVVVRVPVRIKQRSGPEEIGWMRLHIKKTGGKVPKAEHYARSRLTVPKQRKVLAGHETIGLLIAEDGPLSNFLGSAEPPSHARWTHQNLRDRAKYSNTQATLSRIANALRCFERLLQDEDSEKINKDAFKTLFARPKPPMPKEPKQHENGKEPLDLPPARPFWKVDRQIGGFELIRPDEEVPADVDVEIAYARRRGAPDWKPTDFQLADGAIVLQQDGQADLLIHGNTIQITGAGIGFKLTASGFDVNRDVVVVVRAREADGGEAQA